MLVKILQVVVVVVVVVMVVVMVCVEERQSKLQGNALIVALLFREPDLSRGDGDAASRRQRSQKSDPKHPNRKEIVEKPTIWTRGSYLMARPPKGPSNSYRRGVGGSYSHMGEGDPMADLAGTLQSLSHDILDNGDNDDDSGDDGDYDDGDDTNDDGYDNDDGDGGNDDGDNFEGGCDDFEGGGDGDGRQFIQRKGKKNVFSFKILIYIVC
ncbi:hypothetical protein Hdeb2414_s0008g00295051 [Helianthus debilis subsp. tardiflorus]